MQRGSSIRLAAALPLALVSAACMADAATASAASGATIAITTVSYPSPGVQVTQVSVPLDLATYYAQRGIPVPTAEFNVAATAGTLGPAPSIPPPPGPGDMRPDVGKVVEIVEQNGWTSTTTYTRDVRSDPGGGYTDGPWQYGGNVTQPSGGGGGGCTGKTSPDDKSCASPF